MLTEELTDQKAFLKRKLEIAKTRHAEKVCSTMDNKSNEFTTPPAEAAEEVMGNIPKSFKPELASQGEDTNWDMPEVGHPTYATEDVSENRTIQGRFTNFNVADLLFVEVFAGTARLSKEAKSRGLEVLPVDKTSARSTQIHIAQYDLADPEQFGAFMEVLDMEKKRIAAVHLSPACGTASKAREKKLLKWAKKGFRIPQPLRSTHKPMGVDGLQGLDKIRTETANQVYAATAAIIEFCVEHDILCSVENPENSLFWLYPDILRVMQRVTGCSTSFHNCMHGGKRKKLTQWWATKDVFSTLACACDGLHQHAQWNPTQDSNGLRFPTAEEAAYPHLLCKRVVDLIIQYVLHHGAGQHATLDTQIAAASSTSHRWILDMLPKGKKLRPLVSEFKGYAFFLVSPSQEPENSFFFKQQLKGARILQRQMQWGRMRVVEHKGQQNFLWVNNEGKQYDLGCQQAMVENGELEVESQVEVCTLGIPRDPWDFVEKAVAAGHPRSLAIHLNGDIMNMLKENFAQEPHLVIKQRVYFLKKWTERCKELETSEAQMHQRLPEHLRGVLAGKRLTLFKEMLKDLDYPDVTLVDEICAGFKLSGWLPKSNVFPAALKRPTHSMEAVQKMAKGLNKNICKQVASVNDNDLAEEVWSLTQEELEKGWTWIDDACEADEHVLAKRFGLRQGNKTRLIDDCSVGGFNSTCGSCEKLRIHAIDEMAAYIAWCLTTLGENSMEHVVGKTYDLRNAYKQYGIDSIDRSVLRIAVWNPVEAKVQFLGLNALPFGAIGSVNSFLRISMAIWYIGVRGLRLCWTAFFDDYTLLSKTSTSRSAAVSAESLFQLLGVDFAKEGKKSVEWASKVSALGVILDLDSRGDGSAEITVGHTEQRVQELSKTLEDIEFSGKMSLKEAEKLRGRLQWFETFASGRIAQQALRNLSKLTSTGRKSESLSTAELENVRFLRNRVVGAPPTRIRSTSLNTWYIFSDGACEGESEKLGSLGSVLVSPCGIPMEFISERVPEGWMQFLLGGSRHPIYELELLPVWISLIEWEGHLENSQCVFYLDNEAARGSLINGSSSQLQGACLIKAFVLTEMNCQVKVWFARVPTSSNIADSPSRLDTTEMEAKNVKRRRINWSALLERMRKDGSETWGFNNGILSFPICS